MKQLLDGLRLCRCFYIQHLPGVDQRSWCSHPWLCLLHENRLLARHFVPAEGGRLAGGAASSGGGDFGVSAMSSTGDSGVSAMSSSPVICAPWPATPFSCRPVACRTAKAFLQAVEQHGAHVEVRNQRGMHYWHSAMHSSTLWHEPCYQCPRASRQACAHR